MSQFLPRLYNNAIVTRLDSSSTIVDHIVPREEEGGGVSCAGAFTDTETDIRKSTHTDNNMKQQLTSHESKSV